MSPTSPPLLRILHMADLHLDRHFRWLGQREGEVRRRQMRTTLERIVALARELEVDALTVGGDLYEHDRFAPDTGAFLAHTFGALAPIPVLLAPGNHDWYGPSSLYAQTVWPANVHLFREGHFTPFPLAEGVTIWGLAHQAPTTPRNLLAGFRTEGDGLHLALFHGSLRSALQGEYDEEKEPHAPFEAEDVRDAGFLHALTGHYHQPRHDPTLTYPGNPDPLEFGETGVRGAVLLTLHADGTLERETHPVATTAVRDLTVDLTGIEHTGQVQARVREALQGFEGYARITLEGELPPQVTLRRSELDALTVPGVTQPVVRVGRINEALDLEALRNEATVRGAFVNRVLSLPDTDLDETLRRRILLTGLRALEGRGEDLEVL